MVAIQERTSMKVVKHMKRTDVLICGTFDGTLNIPDNKLARCEGCFRQVQYRPHAPAGKKLCFECAAPLVADGDNELLTTQRMIDDFKAAMRRRTH